MKVNNTEVKKQKPIKFYSTGSKGTGLNVVKSPVKLMILSMLGESEMEFDEIVKNTGKSKSTISVHLKALRKDGVVSFKFNPDDQRKKIFYISSRFLGEIEAPESVEFEERKIDFIINNIVNTKKGTVEFPRLLFHTVRSTLIQEGLSIDPILYEAGLRIGDSIFDKLNADDVETFAKNVIDFWEEHGLGIIEIDLISENKIGITSKDCFECGLLPKTGKPACFLDLGIIESLISKFLGTDVIVAETRCFTMGDDHCYFEIEPTSGGQEEVESFD
ncbi:MAG: ArsR family transcriptional regulator [Methanobrevibacter sp.]|nr:ArsR family transcriptional regulator [Methanobrevibacter sp.]